MKYDFVTVDFEIANNQYNSACSIGITAVTDLEIVQKEYFLIHPPTLQFTNTNIHGISADDVKDTPFFPEVWDKIKQYFAGNIVIAHNAIFDMTVLKACDTRYKIDIPDFKYMCSINITSCICDKSVRAGLSDRAQYFGICMQEHHNALSDATTCAQILIEAVKTSGYTCFPEFCKHNDDLHLHFYSDVKEVQIFGKAPHKFNNIVLSEIAATTEKIDNNHVFFGKTLVFTGELKSLDRKTAMQKAVNLGGILKSAVSKKTNYLIVGAQDKSLVGEDGMSSKEETAYKLKTEGYDIIILNEDEFLNLL